MKRIVLLAVLALAACGSKPDGGTGAPSAAKMELPAAADAAESSVASAPAVAGPQFAYAYRLGFRLPAARIAEAQAAHLKLCDTMGPARCRLIAQDRRAGDMAGGSMAFEVDTGLARDFADRLDAAVGNSGGSTTSRAITAEYLSKSMIDTAARIRAKQALADRLLVLIRNHNGKIGELVEAERAFAETQELLDAARSEMETMQRRVSMSRIDADYQSVGQASGGDWAIRDAIDSAGLTLGSSVAALIRLVMFALPWLVIAIPLVWGLRRWQARRPGPRG